MTQQIWKFPLGQNGLQEIAMPKGSIILDVQNQNGTACIWALVDPMTNKVKRTFEIFGTGEDIPPGHRQYIGTYQLANGRLVLHLFEVL